MPQIGPTKINKKIKDKYSVVSNAFRLSKVKNAELDKYHKAPKDLVVAEVGDVKQEEFFPQVKLGRWGDTENDNEVNFSVRLQHSEKGTESVGSDDDKITWEKGNLKAEFYDYNEGEGGYKFVWYLKRKPKTNKLTFSLQTKGLKFYYQSPLTQKITDEQKAKGYTATETDIFDENGKVVAHRPENVVGSYAVYHESKGGMVDKDGKDYKTGKAFQIYRPHLIDANGKEAWGILSIDTNAGTYSVEIPQAFLDTAVYPIKSNDTFGYTSEASTASWAYVDNFVGSAFTFPSGGGTVSSISFLTNQSIVANAKGIICRKITKNIVSDGISVAIAISRYSKTWQTADYETSPVLTGGIGYIFGFVPSNDAYTFYDTGDANQGYLDNNSYDSPQDLGNVTLSTNKFSVYVTYTANSSSMTEVIEGHAAYTDAVFCYATGGTCYSTNGGNIRMGYRDGPSYGNCDVAVRFTTVAIPQGATINDAYFLYEAQDTDASTDNVKIYGEDVDDAAMPSTTFANADSPTNKTPTTAYVEWTLPNQTDNESYISPDIKTVIQEIVDREGWSSGNDMCILIRNNGATENHNALNTAGKFVLYITYTEGGGTSASLSPSTSISASPSLSPSTSTSTSPSVSESSSISASTSESVSPSVSESTSESVSPSISESSSISASTSPSTSASVSPSTSISQSPSVSPSTSVSSSPSIGISSSVSPSLSESISASFSESISTSASPSVSESSSISASLSESVSSSVSPSISSSSSISASLSISISPSLSESQSQSISPSISSSSSISASLSSSLSESISESISSSISFSQSESISPSISESSSISSSVSSSQSSSLSPSISESSSISSSISPSISSSQSISVSPSLSESISSSLSESLSESISPSLSESVSSSISESSSISASKSTSTSPSISESSSVSASLSESISPSISESSSISASTSPSLSQSVSASLSISQSPSLSVSLSISISPSSSPSPSDSPSISISISPSISSSLSPSISDSSSISSSKSESNSPSLSISVSPSISESSSISASQSPSVSESISSSISESISPSISESSSISESISPSLSESISPSQSSSISPSVSESISLSVSASLSTSASPSLSESISASLSPSLSESISPSISSSLSASVSPSISASVSPSLSESISSSLSISVSPSISPSVSPSPSPVDIDIILYTKPRKTNLFTNKKVVNLFTKIKRTILTSNRK